MSFLRPKLPTPPPVVDPGDTQNRLNSSRARRLAQGGGNATFLASTVENAPTRPTATLTGLSGR